VIGIAAIVVWQASIFSDRERLSDKYRLTASSGVHDESRFVYFAYHLGLYPVATTIENPPDNRAAAKEILRDRGDTLRTEWGHTIRYGDWGKGLLYLPWAWATGSAKNPQAWPFHAFVFIVGLVLVYGAFWSVRLELLGSAVVLLMGSNPFQLFEVYRNENIFGWPITATLFVLALHIPLLFRTRHRNVLLWIAPFATGILLASVRQVRSEPVPLLLTAAVIYLTLPRVSMWRCLVPLCLLALSFIGAGNAWQRYFDAKLHEAETAVIAAGGTPFPGPRDRYHSIWHPIWCGLGDFDKKYGYDWTLDQSAAAYAFPILKEKYGVEVPKWNRSDLVCRDDFWDDKGLYYKTPYELPHYGDVLRDKVLGDIRNDPMWYLQILGKRLERVFSAIPPISLSAHSRTMGIPAGGYIALAVAGVLLIGRGYPFLILLFFSLPLAATSMILYSLRGTTYYTTFHLMAAALAAAWLLEGILCCRRKRQPSARQSVPPVTVR
jgi:hypothetical protein